MAQTILPGNRLPPGPAAAPAFLRGLLDAALQAVSPERTLAAALPEPPEGRTLALGAGKASAAMAGALEAVWEGPLSGEITVPDGYERPLQRLTLRTAAHPAPDERSVPAAAHALALAGGLGADDLLIALISGGGSALWASPRGVSLAEKRRIGSALMAAGAPIADLNAVRGALSNIKAGGLARAAAPARVVTLAVSDVPGDDPALIASGPTVASAPGDPAAICARWGVRPPPQWPAPHPAGTDKADFRLIGSARQALEAAASLAREHGVAPVILNEALQGDAEEAGAAHARLALAEENRPCVLLSGGELTVREGAAPGRGGPNTHYALSLALNLSGAPGIFALAADTDGVDGRAGAAGALIGPHTLADAERRGLNLLESLKERNSAAIFETLDSLILTGPTHTNVSDFRAIYLGVKDF